MMTTRLGSSKLLRCSSVVAISATLVTVSAVISPAPANAGPRWLQCVGGFTYPHKSGGAESKRGESYIVAKAKFVCSGNAEGYFTLNMRLVADNGLTYEGGQQTQVAYPGAKLTYYVPLNEINSGLIPPLCVTVSGTGKLSGALVNVAEGPIKPVRNCVGEK